MRPLESRKWFQGLLGVLSILIATTCYLLVRDALVIGAGALAVAALVTLFMGAAAGIYSILFLIAQIGLATKDRLVR
jgi:hypothetical protein